MDDRELAFAGAAQQARLLADGTITAPALLDVYLERIARLDPELRSYRVVLADSAREQAAAAQARLDAGERLPLLGVPIAIKDDVDVAGEVTTCGTSAHGPARTADAEVVRRLREAGAVIVGKTAVPEMTVWSFAETLTFGATRNPWNTDYAPGRQQQRQRRGGRRGTRIDGVGVRRHGVDPDPVDVVWAVRDQAAAGSGAAGAPRRRMERLDRQRPDRANGRGRRTLPRCDERRVRLRRRRGERAWPAADCVEHQGPCGSGDASGRPAAGGGGGCGSAAARARASGRRAGSRLSNDRDSPCVVPVLPWCLRRCPDAAAARATGTAYPKLRADRWIDLR